MAQIDRQTAYVRGWLWAGGTVALAGAGILATWAYRELNPLNTSSLVGAIAAGEYGWGSALMGLVSALVGTVHAAGLGVRTAGGGLQHARLLASGAAVWTVGWALVARGIRREPVLAREPSIALGAPLLPSLARYVDFRWGTLAAYSAGILGSELIVLAGQTVLAGRLQVAPPLAFALSGAVGCAWAGAMGFAGATNARRISIPELSIALLYLGQPIPTLLTLTHSIPSLELTLGPALREVHYIAEMLGRPQLAYWLAFLLLALALVLGLVTGFVLTGSGRIDLSMGTEAYIARRHVSVFRPGFLLGSLVVLVCLIIPPLLVIGMVVAAARAVERTRIRHLGQRDPLDAAAALHAETSSEASPTWTMTALSVGGVATGVMALVIVLSVMSGFEVDLQKKILGANAHAVVLKYSDDFSDYPQVMEKVRKVPGVVGVTPFILGDVMVGSDANVSGALIKGIDPKTVGQVSDLPQNIQKGGSVEYLEHPEDLLPKRLNPDGEGALDEHPARPRHHPIDEDEDDDEVIHKPAKQTDAVLPGIILGRELASLLKVMVGDRVNVISPVGGELGPNGPVPKSRPFRVAGLFYSGMYEYDSKSSYIRLDEAEKFFGIKGASGIELKVSNVDDARRISRQVYSELDGYPFRTKDWGEMNHNLFAALRTEKLVMAIILTIIVIVAAGLIVATVIMLVLEKRKEIAVLKALGVPDGGIVKIFLAEGLQIGIAGSLLGMVAGLVWCLFIEKIGLPLDPEIYYIPSLPVKVEPIQTVLAVVIAVLVTYLACIYPALKASRVEPVEGLKAE